MFKQALARALRGNIAYKNKYRPYKFQGARNTSPGGAGGGLFRPLVKMMRQGKIGPIAGPRSNKSRGLKFTSGFLKARKK